MSGPTWRVIRSSNDPKFMVKGYELADCLYQQSRYRIAETRAMVSDASQPNGYYMGVQYRVFDAERISDADVKAGKSPPLVGVFDTYGDATAWCDQQ